MANVEVMLNWNYHSALTEIPESVKYLGDGDWELPEGAEIREVDSMSDNEDEWVLEMPDGKVYHLTTQG